MRSPSSIVRMLEDLVRIPYYSIYGGTSDGRLVVESDEEGEPHLYLYNPHDGSKKRLTSERIYGVASVRNIPVDRVVFTRDVSSGRELQEIYVYDLNEDREYRAVDMKPLRVFGLVDTLEYIAFTGATSEGIHLYRIVDGRLEELARLPGFGVVTAGNDKYIVGYGSLSNDPNTIDLFIYDLGGGELITYHPVKGSVNNPLELVGDRVVFDTNAFSSDRNKLVILDIKEMKTEEMRFKHGDYDEIKPVEHSSCSYVDDQWIVVGVKEGRSILFIDGRRVETPAGTIGRVLKIGGKLYLTYSSLKKPPTLLEIDLGSGSYRELLGGRLPSSYEEAFGEVRHVYVESSDGLKIPVYIIESREAGRPGPTIVYIHGGPWAMVSDSWRTSIAALVMMGFHVVAPNYRGSTGYGSSFMKLDIGDPGGGDLLDVVAASKYAIETGLASKLFITGYSYGGYMTLWAMVNEPKLYEAGVAGASVVDWEEEYRLGDALFKEFVKILFAGKMDLLKDRSPINKIDRLEKPVCIIHPQNDTRAPLKPLLKLLDKMLELNKRFEAHILPDMGHVITTVDDALKVLLPELLFLEKHK
jgi:dipeptidyl aminopeptidase/acylaminoacyl peptidase